METFILNVKVVEIMIMVNIKMYTDKEGYKYIIDSKCDTRSTYENTRNH